MEQCRVLMGGTSLKQADEAARDLYRQLNQPDLGLVLLFISPDYDLDTLAPALAEQFADTLVVGCTTAGEIGPTGYQQGSISGVSFGEPDFFAVARRIDDLHHFELSEAFESVMTARYELSKKVGGPIDRCTFALMLVDGLSTCEEVIASRISSALGNIPLVGGSAGDNMRFQRTSVLIDGEFHSNVAALVLVATRYPFEVFKSEHAARTGERMVITEADVEARVVTEINAEPAAAEYSRLLGLNPDHLTPTTFAGHPLVLQVGGVPYVRSIQRVNSDLSLSFFCTVDEGVVLSGTRALDLVDSLTRTFQSLKQRLGKLQLVLGCDCILRALIADHHADIRARMSALLADNNVIGFNTYGEQFNAMHVNQTFTGIAIGYSGNNGRWMGRAD